MPIKIIVNADDLGMTEAVNEAIFSGMERGVITSATILANGAAVKTAVKKLHLFPRCSFGIHLNLTEFAPTCETTAADLACILDKDGRFNGNAIREVGIDRRMTAAAFREWSAQIESLIRLGLEPSHLDGHHHVHTIPRLLPALAEIRRRYKIGKARISRNLYVRAQLPSRTLLAKKTLFNFGLRAIGFKTTRLFTDVTTFAELCTAARPRASTVEIMAHPGSSDLEEARFLEKGWSSQLAYPTELISYQEL